MKKKGFAALKETNPDYQREIAGMGGRAKRSYLTGDSERAREMVNKRWAEYRRKKEEQNGSN